MARSKVGVKEASTSTHTAPSPGRRMPQSGGAAQNMMCWASPTSMNENEEQQGVARPPVEARMLPYSLLPSRSSGGSTWLSRLRAPVTNSGRLELCVNLPLTVRGADRGRSSRLSRGLPC